MKKLIFLIFLSISTIYASTTIWREAKVIRVVDGDTLILKEKNKRPFKARLIAIDTFETKVNHRTFMQLDLLKTLHRKNKKNTVKRVLYYGYKARDYVKRKYLNKTVKYRKFGTDRYGRTLVWIQVLNYALVRRGFAIWYPNNKLEQIVNAYGLELSREANLEKRGIYEDY